jgi:hypothetical protein
LFKTEPVKIDEVWALGPSIMKTFPLITKKRRGEPCVGHWIAYGGSNEFVVLNKPVIRVLRERKRGQIERVDNGFL